MGSWNETCALTRLAIKEGDPTVLFLLVSRGYGSKDEFEDRMGERCFPFLLPIFGEYNDYGSIELNEADQAYNDAVYETIPQNERGETTNLVELLEAVERGNQPGFNQVLMHEPIWRDMVEATKAKTHWLQDKPYDEIITESVNKMSELRTLLVEVRKRNFAARDEKKEPGEGALMLEFELMDKLRDEVGHMTPYLISNAMTIAAANPVMRERLKEGMLTDVMASLTRFTWTPQAGAGSQDDTTDLLVTMSKKLISFVEERDRRWKEEYGEYEEDTDQDD